MSAILVMGTEQTICRVSPPSSWLACRAICRWPTLASKRSAANADVPMFLAHGTYDPVVALAAATATRDALIGLGYPAKYPMQHAVCAEEIADLNRWCCACSADRRRRWGGQCCAGSQRTSPQITCNAPGSFVPAA
jgi:hypothetical protein